MSADNKHLAGGMERERERERERNKLKQETSETCFYYYYYYYHFCYYYCGRIAKMCVRGACMALPLLSGTVLRRKLQNSPPLAV